MEATGDSAAASEDLDWDDSGEPADDDAEENDLEEQGEVDGPSESDDEEDEGDEDDSDRERTKPKKKPAAPKPKARKRKVKRGGQDVDVDLDDEDADKIFALISDPARYRYKVDGEELEDTLEDILKDAEYRGGSKKRMREAQEIIKKHNAELSSLKGDKPKLIRFLRDHMDIEPMELLLHECSEELELVEMKESNPEEWAKRMEMRAQENAERKVRKQQEREKAEREEKAERKRVQDFMDDLKKEIAAQKLPRNELAKGLVRQMALESDGSVSARDLVYEARRAIRDSLGSMLPEDPAELARVLGPKRIAALAKARVNAGGASPARPRKQRRAPRPEPARGASALERWQNR